MNATGSLTRRAACIATLMLGLVTVNADAAGLLIADGGLGGQLEIKEHDVNVTINNGIAVTRVRQVFHNTERRQVEALYTFPVPRGASVASFSMWINDKEVVGEVVEKERARQIYESYKPRRKDPGLLEQVDFRTFEMRICPIGPEADQQVEICYYQELDFDSDTATYVYPLATATRADIDARTTGRFSFNLEVKSAVPITWLESPSHSNSVAVAAHTPAYQQISLEVKSGSLAQDVVVAYSTARPHTGIDIITSKRAGEDGYFCATLTAGEELAAHDAGMDYVFVLDISGSMANDRKMQLSRNAVAAFVKELSPQDRFEIITFNVQPETLFARLVDAAETTQAEADDYLRSKAALGGTVLNPAITAAYRYKDPDRQLNVLILSDGLTEQRERQTLLQLIGQRPQGSHVFCIGIGNDVNRPLLEQLAEDSGGLAAFISHGDNFARQAKAFRRKLTRPAMTDITLDLKGAGVYDVEPRVVPNLYHGAPVRIYGRYRDAAEVAVIVKGSVLGKPFAQSATVEFPDTSDANPEIERMWAWHRIDNLLKAADRTGSRASVVDEVIVLGEAYSIATEYTSFLVLENDAEYQRWKIERRNRARVARDRAAQVATRAALDDIRDRALANVGPEAARTMKPRPATPTVQAQRTPSTPGTSQPSTRSTPQRGTDFDPITGTGPVGPLFIAAAALLRKLKQR